MYLVAMNRTTLNQPFNVTLEIRTQDNLVTIALPAIAFDLSVGGTPVEGFAYTVPGTNLPSNLWPVQLLGERFVVAGQTTGSSYSLTIGTDGALTISAPDGSAIPVTGGQQVAPTTVSYLLPVSVLPPPTNVKLNDGPSNIVGASDGGTNFLEYFAKSIVKDQNTGVIRVANCWSDNSAGGAPPRNFLALMARAGIVDPVTAAVTYGPVKQITFPGNLQFDTEAVIAVNPTNVNNMAAIVIREDWSFAPGDIGWLSMLVSASFDGGSSWSTPITPWTFAQFPYDPWLVFDSYGNCFISAGVTDPPGNFSNPAAFEIRGSIDGGLTFPNTVAHIRTVDIAGSGFPDFPKIAVGPDGSGISGNLALWFCYDDYDFTATTLLPTVGYVPVTSLGAYGVPVHFNSFSQIPSGPAGIRGFE